VSLDAVRCEITEVFDAGYCHCDRLKHRVRRLLRSFISPTAAFRLRTGELAAEPGSLPRECRISPAVSGVAAGDRKTRRAPSFRAGIRAQAPEALSTLRA
jgi:hypothetical protein